MKKAALIIAVVAFLPLVSPLSAKAQFNDQTLCKRRIVGVEKYKKLAVADGYDNVETYMMDSDFRKPAKDIP